MYNIIVITSFIITIMIIILTIMTIITMMIIIQDIGIFISIVIIVINEQSQVMLLAQQKNTFFSFSEFRHGLEVLEDPIVVSS